VNVPSVPRFPPASTEGRSIHACLNQASNWKFRQSSQSPVPMSETRCGLLPPLSVIETNAEREPFLAG
jgi:hypothetical protein